MSKQGGVQYSKIAEINCKLVVVDVVINSDFDDLV